MDEESTTLVDESKQDGIKKQNDPDNDKEHFSDTLEDLVDQMEIEISDQEESVQKEEVAPKKEEVEQKEEIRVHTEVKGHLEGVKVVKKRIRRSSTLEGIEFRPISLDYQLSDNDIIKLMELLQVNCLSSLFTNKAYDNNIMGQEITYPIIIPSS